MYSGPNHTVMGTLDIVIHRIALCCGHDVHEILLDVVYSDVIHQYIGVMILILTSL